MKHLLTALLTLTLCTLTPAIAQTITIKGQVVEAGETNLPMVGAFIKMNPKDSTGLKNAGRVVATDEKGNFTIRTNKPNSEIEVSFIGFKPQTIKIPTGQSTLNLGKIALEEAGIMIDAAVVTAQANIAKISGDTTQYNAAAFKTNPDANTEDLLKKMPGVTVNTDGSVESAGKKISKVTVNGKTYFEDDPTLALKSLPVDAVESIQFYDDKTEDAKFSGFDDGERIRTINIVTKKNVMNSVIGKVFAGYGTDQRYAAGAGINWMTDNHRLVVTAQTNNVNDQDFTLSDIGSSGSGSGGGWRGMRGSSGVNLGSFSTGVNGGIRQTQGAGINYSGEFGKKLKLSASYFFNNVNNDQIGSTTQDYLTMPRYYEQSSWSRGFQTNHRFNAKAEWNPTETDRITFQPRVNYSLNHGASYNASSTWEGFNGPIINAAKNNYNKKLDSYNISADLWWQHRFKKAGRTLSLGGVVSGQKSWGDMTQFSDYVSRKGDDIIPDSLRQLGYVDMSRYSLTGSATYSEPISERSRLNFNYTINYDRTISDRQGWNLLDYDQQMQQYSLMTMDTLTTNYMNRNTTTQTAGLGYSYTITEKLNVNVSARYQYAQLNNTQEFPPLEDPFQNYNFNAVLPSVNVRFTPNKAHNLNFNYNTNSVFPTINQLQDILDISNILQVSKGNPDLKQSYNHNVGFFYNYNNIEKNFVYMIGASASFTQDYIANHRRFLTADTVINGVTIPNGARFTTPTNLNGYLSTRLFTNITYDVKPIKSKLNVTAWYRYSKTPSIENSILYMSQSNSIGGRVALTSNLDRVDFTFSYSPSVTLSQSGTGRFDRYFGHNAEMSVTVNLWKGFYLRTDGQWRNSFGTQESYSQHYGILNASIAQKFFKNQFEIKLSAYDLLNQNRSFWQSTTDTYTQTTTSNVLTRYFMASLTWKIDTRKKGNSTNQTQDGGSRPRQMMGRPMGGSYGGGMH